MAARKADLASQKASKGLIYAAFAATRTVKDVTEIAVAFATQRPQRRRDA